MPRVLPSCCHHLFPLSLAAAEPVAPAKAEPVVASAVVVAAAVASAVLATACSVPGLSAIDFGETVGLAAAACPVHSFAKGLHYSAQMLLCYLDVEHLHWH